MKNSDFLSKEVIKEIGKAMKKMQDQLSVIPKDAFRNLSLAQSLLSSIPGDFLKRLGDDQKRISQTLKGLDFSQLSNAVAQIQKPFLEHIVEVGKSIKYANDTIKEANTILLNLGWWIYPDWTIPSLRSIIDLHKKGKDDVIEQEIIDFFNNKKLDEMIKGWKVNKKLSDRMRFLEDGIWAHQQGKYTLSVPALLLHVEGMINENSGKKGYIKHFECVDILRKNIDKKYGKGSLSSLFPLAVFKFAQELLSESFKWGKPSRKGRNPIAHGHNLNYDDKAFSLKLILLIDFIQKLI